jgi:5'(3')-deoxyribonucleotidase
MIIGIDMDGVIANFTGRAISEIKKEFNINLKYDEITENKMGAFIWDLLLEEEKKRVKGIGHIYEYICPPKFFSELEPYENSIESIKRLYNDGNQIVFITKPLEWRYCTEEKIEWLKKYFSDIEYTVIMISKMEDKVLINIDIMIDDDERVLSKFNKKNIICIAQPWNKEFREKFFEGFVAKGIKEAIDYILENKEYLSLLDKEAFNAI